MKQSVTDLRYQRRRERLTYDDARALIQASDAELDKGLCDRRVLILKGPSPRRAVLFTK